MNNVVLTYFYPTKDGNLMIFDAVSDGIEPALLPSEGVPFSPRSLLHPLTMANPQNTVSVLGP